MTAWRWTKQDRDRFATYAAPSAIDAHLAKTRAEHRRLGRLVEWLENLQAIRQAEVEAGIWPTNLRREEAP